jgi:hypothetical protein
MIVEVVADVVADMHADEEAVPEPIALGHYSGKFTVSALSEFSPPSRAIIR